MKTNRLMRILASAMAIFGLAAAAYSQSYLTNYQVSPTGLSTPRIAISLIDNQVKLDYWLENFWNAATFIQSDSLTNLGSQGVIVEAVPVSASGHGSLLLTNWPTARQRFFTLREQAPAAPIHNTTLRTQTLGPSATNQVIDCSQQVKVTIPAGTLSSPQVLSVGTAFPSSTVRQAAGMTNGTIFEIKLGELDHFELPLTIELPYDPSLVRSDLPLSNAVTVAFWLPQENRWSVRPCQVDGQRHVLTFQTDHLSVWAPVYVAAGWDVRRSSDDHFVVLFHPAVSAKLGTTTIPPADYFRLTAAELERAYYLYPSNLFAAPTTPMWVFIDAAYTEAEWKGLSGDIYLPTSFKGTNDLRASLGHELFHAVQNGYYNIFAAGGADRVWWHEACAEYAGQVLVASNSPPFDIGGSTGEDYLRYDFLAYPLTQQDSVHEYGAANFLDFLFRNSSGKLTFKGQFDALKSYSLTDSLLSRLENYVKAQTGKTLHYFYRQFAADFAFNTNGYAPAFDPWGPAGGGSSSRILKMGPEVIELIQPLQLAPGYTALLFAMKVETLPGTTTNSFRIRVQDPDPNVILDVYRPGSLRASSRPSPGYSSEYLSGTGNVGLGFPALTNGEYLALIASNSRRDVAANLRFTIDRWNFASLASPTISIQRVGEYEWRLTADVQGGYPPYTFVWSTPWLACKLDVATNTTWAGAKYGKGNPVTLRGTNTTSPPLISAKDISLTVTDSHGNAGHASGAYGFKAQAEVTLSNLDQRYDGTPKSVTVTTIPPGLSVTVWYDGSLNPPTGVARSVESYAVTATISDLNYWGSATGHLYIDGL
jgi:hypothetical protein